MKLTSFAGLLLALFSYVESASIMGHGTDILGHMVPVKCTVDCDTEGPSFGPVVPHLPHPVDPILPKPVKEASTDTSAAPVVPAFYPKSFYAGLHPVAHLFLGHHGVVAHPANLAHPVVEHVEHQAHTLGGYATGPVDINGDGQTYTGPEDDNSPIVGGPVAHSFEGDAKWHGPYQGPVVHAPAEGFGDHHVLPHLAHGPYDVHSAAAHPGLVTGQGPAGVVTDHGFAVGLSPHLPASTHFGVVNTHDLLHQKLGAYAIVDMKHLENDCPSVHPEGIVIDKTSKPTDAEATPTVESTPQASD